MKKFLFSLLTLVILSSQSFSQVDSIKQYPLRDYVAPDIKYQRMDFLTSLFLNGTNQSSDESDNYFSSNLQLNYYEYINTTKFQGISDAYFSTNYSSQWGKEDTTKYSQHSFSIRLDYYGQNRIYYPNQTFWGIHGDLRYRYQPHFSNENDRSLNTQFHSFTITPYVSFGKGRIQPIESARQALDILIALEKNNRLSKHADKILVDSLARVANHIRYKRFYDQRFKRIYQLEELDKAIQNMDLVDSIDMIYFANLSDIWDYAGRYKRGSGLRFEGGIIPDMYSYYSKYTKSDTEDNNTASNKTFGIYGFFSLNRMRPISYSWQSDLMIDLTMGYSKAVTTHTGDNNRNLNSETVNGMLNASWQFGYFPNTRTYAGITPFTAVSFYQYNYNSDKPLGIASGFQFNSYYYISPRFRISLYANISYTDNFDRTVPTPFWNTVSYTNDYNTPLRNTNDFSSFPIDADNILDEKIDYRVYFSLRYAIL